MKRILPVLGFLGLSCAAVSGPAPSAAWGPFGARYGDYYKGRGRGRGRSSYGGEEKGSSISIRAGWLMPSGADEAFDATWTAGFAYTKLKRRSTIKFMEFGVDYAATKSDDRESTLIIPRFDVGIGSLAGGTKGPYGVVGIPVIIETSEITLSKKKDTFWSIDLNVGFGYRAGKIDLRLNYIMMLGSENVTGVTIVGVGFCF